MKCSSVIRGWFDPGLVNGSLDKKCVRCLSKSEIRFLMASFSFLAMLDG